MTEEKKRIKELEIAKHKLERALEVQQLKDDGYYRYHVVMELRTISNVLAAILEGLDDRPKKPGEAEIDLEKIAKEVVDGGKKAKPIKKKKSRRGPEDDADADLEDLEDVDVDDEDLEELPEGAKDDDPDEEEDEKEEAEETWDD